ncbi:hypothetical protein CKO42_25860 [Lamprobacter modestohalophilus]|uniref:Uncharacterized protein n=1 Tax=Lamprobacter modestohalophilus TaxID=1064514 RepID=A0A9X1B6Q3_9GAMM|nr:hypothetical protein [Lamprobacter modestohalophilus]
MPSSARAPGFAAPGQAGQRWRRRAVVLVHRLRIAAPSGYCRAEVRALRLGLAVRALPDRASLRLFSTASDDLAPISGAEIKASLERDRAALPMASADAADAEPLYWSPLLLGGQPDAGTDPARGLERRDVLGAPGGGLRCGPGSRT